ncbi:hypothetical protein HG530_009388 [Fusarium avenaceum]|nr:hypothetical protein HG530_009388 [Fusarium avenaceum]
MMGKDVDRGLDGGLSTAGVDDNVGAVGETSELEDVLGVLLGSVGLCDGGAEETDRAGAHDNDRVAGLDAGLLDDVHGDGERLNQSTLLLGDVVGELEAEVGRGGPVAGQGAVVGRCSGEDHVRAEVVLSSEAVLASAARVAGLEGDAIADLEGLDLGTNLYDGAGRLVAQNHGVLDDELANGAVDPVVHVGTADAGVVDGDEDIVGALEGGLGALLEGDIAGLVEHEGQVLCEGGCQLIHLRWFDVMRGHDGGV